MKHTTVRYSRLSLAVVAALAITPAAFAQSATDKDAPAAQSTKQANPSDTSNTTRDNDTQRAKQLDAVVVKGKKVDLGGGLMTYQSAPKAVSTVGRDALAKQAPGSNFTQAIDSIPGVNSATDDVSGLSDGDYSLRGFAANEVGVTVNGAPITDSGSYGVYATEYGDTENYGDITVEQGTPDLDQPDSGAAGGHIAWATINPSHQLGAKFTQSLGSHNYQRSFLRFNTGDVGPVRSWLSYSYNSVDKWRGKGGFNVYKIDGKSIWQIDEDNSISASLQYNHEIRNSYDWLTKSDLANHGYFYDYATTFTPGSTSTFFYGLHTNLFRNYMFSLDGEFQLGQDLHLSVVPYFQYGGGGGGTGSTFTEAVPFPTFGGEFKYGYSNMDLNQDGQVLNGKKYLVYGFSNSTTWRPGVVVKFKQDLNLDNSLEYGFWYERPKQDQSQAFSLVSGTTGMPLSPWGNGNFIRFPDGQIVKAYDQHTETPTQKYFVTDTWTPNDQWLVSLGAAYVRINRNGDDTQKPDSSSQTSDPNFDKTFDKVTPALGIRFNSSANSQFYYGGGSTFRSPPNTAIVFNDLAGVPTTLPESAWNNDFGWRYYGDRFATNLMIYRSNFHNKTITGFDQASGQSIYVQIPRLRMQGFDAEASWNIDENWKLYGSYGYTVATVESDLNAGTGDGIYPTKGKRLFNTPRNILYTALNYDNGPFWASFSGRYKGSFYGDYMNTEQVGGYATFNLSAGYHFHDWGWFDRPSIKVNLFNIFDRHALTSARNASSFIASNPTHIKDVNGTTLYASAPYYSLLEPRTFMVTFGTNFE